MALSHSTLWFMILPTWITGALLLYRYFQKRSELHTKKAPIPIPIHRHPY